MKKEDAEEFTQSLGQLVAGSYRQIALAKRLGVPKALGLSTEEWVNDRLGGYVRYSIEERRKIVGELADEGLSRRAIGEVLGVHKDTVRGDLASGENSPPSKSSKKASESIGGENSPLDAVTILAADDKLVSAARKEAAREQRRSELKNIKAPSLPDGTFDVIYADPPWRYNFARSESRAIENQYGTLSTDEICALAVPMISSTDSVLFLWATSPKLQDALTVLDAWDFTYKTLAVWDKERIGMGYYFRQQHELLLVATQGEPKVPEPTVRPPSVFRSARQRHSQKPTAVYEMIERMYPQGHRVELFAREARDGWSAWGNEINAA